MLSWGEGKAVGRPRSTDSEPPFIEHWGLGAVTNVSRHGSNFGGIIDTLKQPYFFSDIMLLYYLIHFL